MQTQVPGNYTATTQPYPTRPEPLDPIVTDGITEEFLLDYTPELKRRAEEILSEFRVGGLYVPALPYPHDNAYRNVVGCVGGLNIYHPPVADPTTGIMYASHRRSCSAPAFMEATNGVDEERGLPGQSAGAVDHHTGYLRCQHGGCAGGHIFIDIALQAQGLAGNLSAWAQIRSGKTHAGAPGKEPKSGQRA